MSWVYKPLSRLYNWLMNLLGRLMLITCHFKLGWYALAWLLYSEHAETSQWGPASQAQCSQTKAAGCEESVPTPVLTSVPSGPSPGPRWPKRLAHFPSPTSLAQGLPGVGASNVPAAGNFPPPSGNQVATSLREGKHISSRYHSPSTSCTPTPYTWASEPCCVSRQPSTSLRQRLGRQGYSPDWFIHAEPQSYLQLPCRVLLVQISLVL